MAGIRFSGMASGLPPNIVDQIMDAERIPVKQMETKKATEDEKYKLIQDLETKVSEIPKSIVELVGTRGFSFFKLNSGDPSVIDGSADPANASTGTWMVEVDQLAQKPGAMTNGFTDPDRTEIGVGYIKFQTPDGVKEVYINGQSSTLNSVASMINKSGTGLRASVVNDRSDKDAPYKLMVTGLATGDDNQVDFPIVYLLDGDQDFFFDIKKSAQNAKVKVDGFEFEIADNQLKDVIPGVVLDLKQPAPGKQVAVTIKEDYEVIAGKIKTFVDAYNAVLGFIQGQHKLEKGKDGKERLGPMGGDGLLRTLENDLRRLIISPQFGVQGSINRVSQLGIEFNRNGTLNLNTEKFNKVLAADAQSVANFFRGDGFNIGFVPAIKRQVGNTLNNAFGPIPMRKKSITDKIKQLDDRIDNKNRQLERREDQLRQKFADLEAKMSKINQQGSSLAAMAQKQGQ